MPRNNNSSETLSWIDWGLDKVSSWGPIIAGLGISGISGWATWATEQLYSYAPFSWVFSSIFSAFVFTLIYLLYSIASRISAQRELFKSYHNIPVTINPLEQEFIGKRININDFKSPIPGQVISDKLFRNCELIGPAVITFMNGANLNGINFLECDLVVIKTPSQIHNVLPFKKVQILDCKIYNMTIYMDPNVAKNFANNASGSLNWITEVPK